MGIKRPERRRAPNLDEEAVSTIVGMLDGWDGEPLSWEALIDRVEKRLYARYSRQALHKHERIREAFNLRRTEGDGVVRRKRKVSLDRLHDQQQIERLTAENTRLKAENNNLLERFARWLYNAHVRGLDEAFLEKPLPPVDRNRTDKSEAKIVTKSGGRGSRRV